MGKAMGTIQKKPARNQAIVYMEKQREIAKTYIKATDRIASSFKKIAKSLRSGA